MEYTPTSVQEVVAAAVDALGGVASLIRPGSRVLGKPNLLMAIEPESGVTTHPEVVRAVIKILKTIDCTIFLGDGPSIWGAQSEKVDEVYEKTGMSRVAQEEGITLVTFEKKRWREKFPLTTWVDTCDALVNVPKFKTHGLTLLTGAIKNLYGLVWETHKVELHKKYFDQADFAKIIVDIYQEAKPCLTVVDGVVAMEGDGPSTRGTLRNLGLILASTDCVALDTILALIMGISPQDVLTTKEAYLRGLGTAHIENITILGEQLNELTQQPFLLPASSIQNKIPLPLLNLVKKFITFYPYVESPRCTQCARCIKACPQKIMALRNKLILINYAKCIRCFCCQEICPSAAIKIKKSLLAKIVGL